LLTCKPFSFHVLEGKMIRSISNHSPQTAMLFNAPSNYAVKDFQIKIIFKLIFYIFELFISVNIKKNIILIYFEIKNIL
jgi:hypothetical protein